MDPWAEFDRLDKLSQNDEEVVCPECNGRKLLPTTRPDIELPCWLCFGRGRVHPQTINVRRALLPMIMNPSVDIWRGDQRYWFRVDRENDKAWIEYPSGVSKEIMPVTAYALIEMNGMKKVTK